MISRLCPRVLVIRWMLPIIGLSLTFIPESGHAAVTIKRQPPGGFNLTPGQRYSMVCFLPDPRATLRWYHNSVPIADGPLFTVTPSSDEHGTYLELEIKSASSLTRGRFQCSNQDDYFDYDFRRVDVSEIINPGDATPVEIVQPEGNSTTIGEGGALVLKCSSGEDSQVTWFLNDKLIHPEPRVIRTSPENQMHVLTLMNVQMHDAGTYRCQNVANYYNRDYVDVNVIKSNFSHGVVISEPSKSRVFVSKGTTFNARCQGNGSRHLEWRHDGVPIMPSTRVIITSAMFDNDVVESQLKITNVQMYDGGDYQCQDTDDFVQTDRRTLVVVVPRNVAPVRITSPSHNETSVKEGGSFTITCVAGINSRIIWRQNGLPLRPRPSMTVMTSRDKVRHTLTMMLTVMEVTSHDTGRYMCQDSRDILNYDDIEMSLSPVPSAITLTIEEPASNYVSVLPGDYLVIRCAGKEETSVRWRHNGRTFDHRLRDGYALTSLIDMRRKVFSSMLTIFDVTKGDSGVFTCEDENNYLNSDSVGVRVPTPVNITTGNLLLRHGDLLQLPCLADYGTVLQWLHNGRLLRHGPGVSIYHAADVLSGKVTSILSFADLKDHDGTYTCRDKNFNGNAKNVTVDYLKEEEQPSIKGGAIQITSGHHLKVASGTKLTLRCKATSSSLILYWTHNKEELTEGDNIRMPHTTTLAGEQWLSLIMEDTSKSAAGVYECRAKNNIDLADSANIEVVDEKSTGRGTYEVSTNVSQVQ